MGTFFRTFANSTLFFRFYGIVTHSGLGLPNLFSTNFGNWSLMNYGGWVDPPPNLDAWSRAYLGWVDVQVVPPTNATYFITSLAYGVANKQVIFFPILNNYLPRFIN